MKWKSDWDRTQCWPLTSTCIGTYMSVHRHSYIRTHLKWLSEIMISGIIRFGQNFFFNLSGWKTFLKVTELFFSPPPPRLNRVSWNLGRPWIRFSLPCSRACLPPCLAFDLPVSAWWDYCCVLPCPGSVLVTAMQWTSNVVLVTQCRGMSINHIYMTVVEYTLNLRNALETSNSPRVTLLHQEILACLAPGVFWRVWKCWKSLNKTKTRIPIEICSCPTRAVGFYLFI